MIADRAPTPATAYPPALAALCERLRFRFWHQGVEFGLTTDELLVSELAALGVRAIAYERSRGGVTEYEVRLPALVEEAA